MKGINQNILTTILLIAVIYGLIFSLVLIIKNIKSKNSHFWLGIFILAFVFPILDTYLIHINFDQIFKAFSWTYYRLLGLIPFTLWIYVNKLIKREFLIQHFEKLMIGLISVELIFRVYMFFIAGFGNQEFLNYDYYFFDTLLETIIIFASLWTVFKIIKAINIHQNQLQNNYSEYSTFTELNWIKELLTILIIVIIVWFIAVPLDYFFDNISISTHWIWIAQALVIFYFGIKGLTQPNIFHNFELSPSYKNGTAYGSIDKTDTDTKSILLIEKALTEEKIYRQQKLTLQEMAQHLNIPARELSKLINSTYKCSFSDFINKHRVEEVKNRIKNKDNQKHTLLAIALDAGFSSKSSFNAMFKKFTGKTPNQFG